ncbi:hypothetical protein M0802_009601 [Mischocyttarus mexicanus]|nr:hypothetical protein M0802_009601 [Mischocyttarus mexicanus]
MLSPYILVRQNEKEIKKDEGSIFSVTLQRCLTILPWFHRHLPRIPSIPQDSKGNEKASKGCGGNSGDDDDDGSGVGGDGGGGGYGAGV